MALGDRNTSLAITATESSPGTLMHAQGSGGMPVTQPQLIDDQGNTQVAHFNGGGGGGGYRGRLVTQGPLSRTTRWIEMGDARIELGDAEPSGSSRAEPLPPMDPAVRHLWRRLGTFRHRHFGSGSSIDMTIQAFVAAGVLATDDPVIEEVRQVSVALSGQPGVSANLPEPWASLIAGNHRNDGPTGAAAISLVTDPVDGTIICVGGLISAPDSFQVSVATSPGFPLASHPFRTEVKEMALAWSAQDDRGNHHVGSVNGWGGGPDQSEGTIEFLAADPSSSQRVEAGGNRSDGASGHHRALARLGRRTMTDPWWSGLLPVDVQVDCSNESHHLRWEAGVLVALDHEDPDGERTLGALGADRAACIEVLDAWARHSDDLGVLTVSSRGQADPVQVDAEGQGLGGASSLGQFTVRSPARAMGPGSFGWTSVAPGGRPMMPGPPPGPFDEITNLLALGGALSQRLVATVISVWSERIATSTQTVEGHMPELTAALYGRVASSVRSWLSDSSLELELEMISPSESPSMSRDGNLVRARLPFFWLSNIWAKDLPVVLSRFSVSTLSSQRDQLQLLTVSPDFGEVRPITIRLN